MNKIKFIKLFSIFSVVLLLGGQTNAIDIMSSLKHATQVIGNIFVTDDGASPTNSNTNIKITSSGLFLKQGKKIGIGTWGPVAPLQVVGEIKSDDLTVSNLIETTDLHTTNNLTTDNLLKTKDLQANGNTTLKNTTINGNVQTNGNVNISNTTTTNDLTVGNQATINKFQATNGIISILGTTNLNNSQKITTKDLQVNDTFVVGGNFTVNGETNLNGPTHINNDLFVAGNDGNTYRNVGGKMVPSAVLQNLGNEVLVKGVPFKVKNTAGQEKFGIDINGNIIMDGDLTVKGENIKRGNVDISKTDIDALDNGMIEGSEITDGTITSVDIKDGEVKNQDIAKNAVNSVKVANNTLTADDLAPNSVGNSELQDNITVNKLTATTEIETPKLIVDHLVRKTVTNIGVKGNIYPDDTTYRDIGSTSNKWNNIYVNNKVNINDANLTSPNKGIRISNDYGYVEIGPSNSSSSIFMTDKQNYFFDKPVWVAGGGISSYEDDLKLQTHGTTRIVVKKSNGNVGVGTINPGAKLDVNGGVKTSNLILENKTSVGTCNTSVKGKIIYNNGCFLGCNGTQWVGMGGCVKTRTQICSSSGRYQHFSYYTDICIQTSRWDVNNQSWTSWSPACNNSYNSSYGSDYDCNYKCENGYHRAGSRCVSNTQTRTVSCSTIPNNTVYNTVNTVTQTRTWNGSSWGSWSPNTGSIYNTTPSSNECRYKCANGYHRKGNSCVSNNQTRTVSCSTIPNNTVYNTVNSITQSRTWNGSSWGSWTPSNGSVYHETGSNTECRYVCASGYHRNGTTCELNNICGDGIRSRGEECDKSTPQNLQEKLCDNTCHWQNCTYDRESTLRRGSDGNEYVCDEVSSRVWLREISNPN